MRRRAFTKTGAVIFLGGLALLVVLGAGALSLFDRVNDNLTPNACHSNLKQIGLGLLQYTQDYDRKFPPLTTESGWVGALMPYTKSTALFQCPAEKQLRHDNLTDYWFGGRLAEFSSNKLSNPATTLVAGDGEASDDPNVCLQVLPPLWASKSDSPARRHGGKGVYLLADGHAEFLAPDAVTVAQPGAAFTFRAR